MSGVRYSSATLDVPFEFLGYSATDTCLYPQWVTVIPNGASQGYTGPTDRT